MSSTTRTDLVEAIGYAISRWQDSVEAFDGAVAEIYELSAPERRCLGAINHAPQPASVIAKETNLTPAAVTTLIDRLEKRGFVRRQPDPHDRRKVLVAPAEKTREMVEEAYRPVFLAGAALLKTYTIDELKLILRFIEEVEVMQKEQRIRLQQK